MSTVERMYQGNCRSRIDVVTRAVPIVTKKRSVEGAVWILIFAGITLGQEAKPNLTGTWRSTGISRGPVVESMLEIRQTESTFAMRHWVENSAATDWSIYPTDGTVIKTKARYRVERTGRWQANILILESIGPGNAPWRRSTERQVIELSGNGRTMTIRFHERSDKDSVHDYAVQFERVK